MEPSADRSSQLRGTARVLCAFDVGNAVDLAEARRRLGVAAANSGTPASAGRRGPGLECDPPPLRTVETIDPPSGTPWRIEPEVGVTIHDFGAICISHRLAFDDSLSSLRSAMPTVVDSPALRIDALRRVEHLVERLGAAIDRPAIAAEREEYVVLELDPACPALRDASGTVSIEHLDPGELAGLLRAETGTLAEEEIDDALRERSRRRVDDLVVVEWPAALVVDRDPGSTLDLLEFLNVQLLELRVLDRRLDETLDDAHASLRSRGFGGRGLGWRWSSASRDWRRIARMQVDAAILYESVQNALKVVGDPRLDRLAASVSRRFGMVRWEAGVRRKLEVLGSIEQTIAEGQSQRRAEILEWIIIALIAFEVVAGFTGWK